MELEKQIYDTIQTISSLFIKRGIPAVPVNLKYVQTYITPNNDALIITELLIHLDELFKDYESENKKSHKRQNLLSRFYILMVDNDINIADNISYAI